MTLLERIKELEDQRTKLVTERATELNRIIEEAEAELRELNGDKPRKAKEKQTRTKKEGVACPICQFVTEPAHGGRQHRSQGAAKRPFKDADLAKLNLKKVEPPVV